MALAGQILKLLAPLATMIIGAILKKWENNQELKKRYLDFIEELDKSESNPVKLKKQIDKQRRELLEGNK